MSESEKSNTRESKVKITIQNLVFQIKIGKPLDLNAILDEFEDVDKIKSYFNGLKVKNDNPRCTILFFVNGFIHITGLKNTKHLTLVEKMIRKKLQSIGIEYPLENSPTIINSLAVGTYPHRLNLNKIALVWENIIYEPEVFPGLVFRVFTPSKVTFVIFSSGKFLILGLRDINQIPKMVKGYLQFAEFIE